MVPRRTPGAEPPASRLEAAVQQVLAMARKARKHKVNLRGDNFYANKLLSLRASATNAFSDLTSQSAGDTTAMAELIDAVFSPSATREGRTDASRELLLALKTTWRNVGATVPAATGEPLFPPTILSTAGRGYLVGIGRQMNGAYASGWYDACFVMMRRLVEIAIIEAFESKNIAAKIKGADGNYLQLSGLIDRALAEQWLRPLSRNARTALPELRDVGHMSAHGRFFTAHREDVDRARGGCRVVVEEFLHHAGLL